MHNLFWFGECVQPFFTVCGAKARALHTLCFPCLRRDEERVGTGAEGEDAVGQWSMLGGINLGETSTRVMVINISSTYDYDDRWMISYDDGYDIRRDI